MKRYFIIACVFCCVCSSRAERFAAVNQQGLLLWYSTLSDSTVMITGSISDMYTDTDSLNYSYINNDTIIVPETVTNGIQTYKVIQTNPYGVFNFIESLTTVYLPKTIELIGDSMVYSETWSTPNPDNVSIDVNYAFIDVPNLQNIYIDEDNPRYVSIDGVVYTKDLKNIIAYPQGRTAEYYSPIEGCEHIARCAFYENFHLKGVEFPNSTKTIGNQALWRCLSLETVFIKDSIEYIGDFAIYTRRFIPIKKMYIGTGLKKIGTEKGKTRGLPPSEVVYCYAITPPTGSIHTYPNGILYVPQKSLNLYKKSTTWNGYGTILPIEPPIVAGTDNATVSWVQNFSATGYMWHLYSDEEHTELVMSLIFDERGYLTELILGTRMPSQAAEHNRALAPQLSTESSDEEDGNERRFAEYYSFTIRSLSPDRQYYYVRQSLAGDEIIDEEQGSFETLPDTETGLDGSTTTDLSPTTATKLLQDGQLLIVSPEGNTYTPDGKELF